MTQENQQPPSGPPWFDARARLAEIEREEEIRLDKIKAKLIHDYAENITLRATLLRIKRKADIMALDTPRGTLAEQNAVEFQLLAGIALRCIGQTEGETK